MNTTDRRLQMWQLMKQHVLPITEPAVTAKATKHGFVLYLDGEEAGSVHFSVSSAKFAQMGASFGVSLACFVKGGRIGRALDAMQLSFPASTHGDWYYVRNSLSEPRAKFAPSTHGTFSFFDKDPVAPRAIEMLRLFDTHYLPGMVRFIAGDQGVIDDVLACPEYYAYPAATVAVVAKIAGEVLDQESLAKRIAVRRLHDSGATRIQEIVSRLRERVP